MLLLTSVSKPEGRIRGPVLKVIWKFFQHSASRFELPIYLWEIKKSGNLHFIITARDVMLLLLLIY